jgi:hypothetical protein
MVASESGAQGGCFRPVCQKLAPLLGLLWGTSFTIAVLLQSPDEDAGRWQMETWPLVFSVLKAGG